MKLSTKRALALLLTLCMALAMFVPSVALAAGLTIESITVLSNNTLYAWALGSPDPGNLYYMDSGVDGTFTVKFSAGASQGDAIKAQYTGNQAPGVELEDQTLELDENLQADFTIDKDIPYAATYTFTNTTTGNTTATVTFIKVAAIRFHTLAAGGSVIVGAYAQNSYNHVPDLPYDTSGNADNIWTSDRKFARVFDVPAYPDRAGITQDEFFFRVLPEKGQMLTATDITVKVGDTRVISDNAESTNMTPSRYYENGDAIFKKDIVKAEYFQFGVTFTARTGDTQFGVSGVVPTSAPNANVTAYDPVTGEIGFNPASAGDAISLDFTFANPSVYNGIQYVVSGTQDDSGVVNAGTSSVTIPGLKAGDTITFTHAKEDAVEVKVVGLYALTFTDNATVKVGGLEITTGDLVEYGAAVVATADESAEGKRFDAWNTKGTLSLNPDELHTPEISFTMPAAAVSLEATYADVVDVILVNSPAEATDANSTSTAVDGQIGEDDVITLTAAAAKPGYRFKNWTVNEEAKGVLANATSPTEATYATNEETGDVTITANYEVVYNVTVTDGTTTAKNGVAASGETVSITAKAAAEGMTFDKWTSTDGVTFTSATSAETTFEMPAKAVTVKATYKVDAEALAKAKTARLAAVDKLVEGLSRTDYTTESWDALQAAITKAKSEIGAKTTVADVNAYSLSAVSAAVSALEEADTEPVKYTVTVNGGFADNYSVAAGDTVTISADIPAGKAFVKWTTSSAITLADANATDTTFTMIAANVAVTATYEDIVSTAKDGWVKSDEGDWYYVEDGEVVGSDWVQSGGEWYYMGDDGAMATGWIDVDDKTYYLDSDGTMETGWEKVGSTWYYFENSGAMVAEDWKLSDGKWYYLQDDGAMKTGWLEDNNKWYYLEGSGAMATGWEKIGGKWYYLEGSGAMAFGWKQVSGKWYNLGASGDGAMKTGWQRVNGKWYYLESSGEMKASAWQKTGSAWYYLQSNGAMAASTTLRIGGTSYTFNASGAWVQ